MTYPSAEIVHWFKNTIAEKLECAVREIKRDYISE